jgi:hypothetical protein
MAKEIYKTNSAIGLEFMEPKPPTDPESWNRGTFKASLRALAQPADVQLSLYRDGCAKVDELAIDFGLRWEVYRHSFDSEITQQQLQKANELDDWLSSISGAENERYWTEAALKSCPEWEHARSLAREALDLFGWSLEVPSRHWF